MIATGLFSSLSGKQGPNLRKRLMRIENTEHDFSGFSDQIDHRLRSISVAYVFQAQDAIVHLAPHHMDVAGTLSFGTSISSQHQIRAVLSYVDSSTDVCGDVGIPDCNYCFAQNIEPLKHSANAYVGLALV